MPDIDPVVFEFQARVNGYLADISRTTKTVDQQLGLQEKRVKSLELQFQKSSAAIGGQVRGLAGTLAAVFTGRELVGLIDGFTRFQNQLKSAGLQGEELAQTQQRLTGIANQYGVSLEAVGTLYGRNAASAKELNLSLSDQFRIVETTAAALKTSGQSSEQAAGALLQLSQVLGGTTVQAEEYNSLIDGARPLLQAVAAGSDKWAGSVAKLTADVKAGNVSVREFVDALLRGSQGAIDKASQSTLTLSGAFQTLQNKLTEVVGGAASASGATFALASAIETLADHLDDILVALSVIGAALAGRYVAGTVAASAATGVFSNAIFAMQARAAGAATTVEALGFAGATAGRSLLAAFGGPVGLAVTALTVAIGYAAVKQSEAAESARDLEAAIAAQEATFGALRAKQATAAAETNNLTAQQRAAITSTASLTGEVQLLASAWGRVAAQAKAAAMEQAKASLSTAQSNYRQAKTAYNDKRESAFRAAPRPFAERGLGANLQPIDTQAALANADKVAGPERESLRRAARNYLDAKAEFDKVQGSKLANFRQEDAAAPSKKGAGRSSRSRSGPSASDIAAKFDQEMQRLEQEELQAKIAITEDAGKRADLARDLLQQEYVERVAQVENDKNFTREQKDAQIAALQRLYGAPGKVDSAGNVIAEARPGLLAQGIARDVERQQTEASRSVLEYQQRALEAQADITNNSGERAALEKRALEIGQEIERSRLDEAIAAGQISEAARAELERIQAADREKQDRKNASPLKKYLGDLSETQDNMDAEVEKLVVGELEHLRGSMRSAVSDLIGTDDPLLNGLIDLLIQDLVIKPLAEALSSAGASGGGGGGFLGSIVGALGGFGPGFSMSLGGRASGGRVNAGQMYRINEGASPGRVEGFIPQGAGHIVPLGRMNALKSGGGQRIYHITVDARNSVNPEGFERRILEQANAQAAAMDGQTAKAVLNAVPTRINQSQRDGF